MLSAKIVDANKPLAMVQTDTPHPNGKQVLLKVNSTGVCHSDLHLWEGGYDMGDGKIMKVTDRGVKYPVTPGHEITGTITEMGKDATEANAFGIGDKVLVYPWIGCGSCPACDAGNENLCDTPRSMGIFQDGGYADYVIIPSYKYLAKLDGVDPDAATSLACSGLTAYTAIKKANVNLPKYIAIIGAGGLGLMGIQIAKAITKAEIICVDLDDKKLQTAQELGADYVVNSKDSSLAQKQIMEISQSKGVDSVVDFVNAPPTAQLGLNVLRKRGNMVMVGLFGGSLEISLVTIPLKAITIQGAYTGNYTDMVEILKIAREGAINPVISKHYKLTEANDALIALKERKIIGRAVINPE